MFKTLVLTALLSGVSSMALAAGGGEAGSLLSWDMLFKAINFLLLLYLLNRFAKKPIANMLSSSAESIKKTVEESKTELAETKKKLEEYQAKLSNMEKELEERRTTALSSIEAEKQQLITDAELQVKRLEEQTQARIEQDITNAKEEIRQYLLEESVKLAEETIAKEVGGKEQKALLDNYTKFLKETA